MKKRFLRVVSILLAFCLLFSASGCNASGYKVTGKIEDGKLVVWLSPIMTKMYYAMNYSIPMAMADGCGFSQDVSIVTFSTADEFQQSMAQKIMAGEPPDVVLATPDELSSKTITSGMLTDLWPFFNYADKAGTIDKDDLMTKVMNGFSFDGKLYTVPLMFCVGAIAVESDKDKKEGLNLLGQPNITFDDYMSQIYQWVKDKGENHFYQIDNLVPEVFYAWDNFIDYKNKTTRMGEDRIYKYFCLQAKKVNIPGDSIEAYSKVTGNSIDDYEGREAALAWYENTCIYKNVYSSLGYTRSDRKADLKENPNGDCEYLPYVTDAGSGYIAYVEAMATIPANSNKKEKAFAFISTAFNAEVLNNNTDAFNYVPMLKSVIKTDIDKIQYLNNTQKDRLYSEITDGNYICTWIDAQIAEWFNDYYGVDHEKEVSNHIAPTREQWNALKKKIELYLSE